MKPVVVEVYPFFQVGKMPPMPIILIPQPFQLAICLGIIEP